MAPADQEGRAVDDLVQQAGSILLEVEKRDAPLSYRAPDSNRSARLLFSLSNTLRLCPERAQARCLEAPALTAGPNYARGIGTGRYQRGDPAVKLEK
jgi:hypothetical protein